MATARELRERLPRGDRLRPPPAPDVAAPHVVAAESEKASASEIARREHVRYERQQAD
jgi:hypothetical protein